MSGRFIAFQVEMAFRSRREYGFTGIRKSLVFAAKLLIRLARLLLWVSRVRLGGRVRSRTAEGCTIILLSYKRPANMEPLVRSVLKCDCVQKVIVHNNNPGYEMREWIKVQDERLIVLEHPKPVPHGIRWVLALDDPSNNFISIDDDTFLYPEQVTRLFLELIRDPSVPHGLDGEVRREPGEELDLPFDYPFFTGYNGIETALDHLTRIYAFTKAHVQRANQLARTLGYESMSDIGNGEDILLSFSGSGRPVIHDAGTILQCASFAKRGIATFTSNGPEFFKYRIELHESLTRIVGWK